MKIVHYPFHLFQNLPKYFAVISHQMVGICPGRMRVEVAVSAIDQEGKHVLRPTDQTVVKSIGRRLDFNRIYIAQNPNTTQPQYKV